MSLRMIRSFLCLALLGSGAVAAQGPATAMPVSYTLSVNHEVRESLGLTGSVASRSASVVASTISGVVVELRSRDGDTVRRGNTLARVRRETFDLVLRSAKGQLAEAAARLELAEARRERAQGLWDEGVISRQDLDDALTEVEASAGRVAQLEAEVARLGDEVERTTIRAPFNGVVVAEHTAVGQWLAAGDPVVELVDVGDLEVNLEVPESYFDGVKLGEKVDVSIGALPERTFAGKVRSIVPKADPQARTFPVKISIPNEEGKVGVGMLARVQIPIGGTESKVLVPKDAIVTEGARRYVFVIEPDDSVRSVDVLTGKGYGAWIAIEGEVAAGIRVVTQGNERLMPGTRVDARAKEISLP